MTRADLMLFLPSIAQLLFVFALGASMGSLINVLVYRIPRGLSVVSPPSRCPGCQTRLTWRENIPILGWIVLKGRCRFCNAPISPEYPIVEAFVAGIFTLFFALWYLVDSNTVWLGVNWGAVAPEWTQSGFVRTWPAFVALLVLLGCLVAMTIIDARTYTIPLVLAWIPAATALVLHVGHAAWFGFAHGSLSPIHPGLSYASDGTRWYTAEGWTWTLATPSPLNWGWIGAGIGGVLGIPVSLLLQRLGLIRQSFADYEEWEKKALAESNAAEKPDEGSKHGEADPAQVWIKYPHARREMFIETAFVAPIVILAVAGAWLSRFLVAQFAGPWQQVGPGLPVLVPPIEAPLWLTVLGGVCLGYLVGGGVVWAVRISGSLAFGKEAMGIGDVHLMAGVGACLGWIDAVLGFFGAAFVGLAYALVGLVFGGRIRRAMPFGPFLAVSTVLVLLFKPLIEIALARLFGAAGIIDLP